MQMCRSLAHIHTMGVCHRDIKPQNLLVDSSTHQLKLCDFGSAKMLVRGEPNIAYICSRYYRAPELIFGATDYTTAIDIWSVGCVTAELLLGQPLFPGTICRCLTLLGGQQGRSMSLCCACTSLPSLAFRIQSEEWVHEQCIKHPL